ncbi:MAG: helix-turn-helix domain-containing protein [Chitinispirillales bacterium]|jgi:transcriptional regulator with XRE-family HTH domain|nr:helix-turn-helix domain-containing protein [Chitinispirillales bacterium]
MKTVMEFAEIFSERLKKIRKERGKTGELHNGLELGTQIGFSGLLGITQAHLSDLENLGKKHLYPRIDEIFRIAQTLNVEPAWLLGLSDADSEQDPLKNNVLLLRCISEMIEHKNDKTSEWKVTVDVKENSSAFGIYRENITIKSFINEYGEAYKLQAAAYTESVYEKAKAVKDEIFNLYIDLLEEKTNKADKEKQREMLLNHALMQLESKNKSPTVDGQGERNLN